MREKLREVRKAKGFTQETIAKLIGINRASYTNIELGRKNPSLEIALRIKETLNYRGDDIFQ